mgnify:CR=1 FL=1|jgi:hypothetical protein
MYQAFCVVSFLKGPNTIYSVGLVLGYQYIVQGQKKSMATQKARISSLNLREIEKTLLKLTKSNKIIPSVHER